MCHACEESCSSSTGRRRLRDQGSLPRSPPSPPPPPSNGVRVAVDCCAWDGQGTAMPLTRPFAPTIHGVRASALRTASPPPQINPFLSAPSVAHSLSRLTQVTRVLCRHSLSRVGRQKLRELSFHHDPLRSSEWAESKPGQAPSLSNAPMDGLRAHMHTQCL